MRSETAGDFREFYLAQGRRFVGSDIDDQAILITRSCIFRPKPDARSVFGRTLIPLNAGQLFRSCRTSV